MARSSVNWGKLPYELRRRVIDCLEPEVVLSLYEDAGIRPPFKVVKHQISNKLKLVVPDVLNVDVNFGNYRITVNKERRETINNNLIITYITIISYHIFDHAFFRIYINTREEHHLDGWSVGDIIKVERSENREYLPQRLHDNVVALSTHQHISYEEWGNS